MFFIILFKELWIFIHIREGFIMSKKFKIMSAILSTGLLIVPTTGLINQFDNNVAKAEEKASIKEITFTDAQFIEATKLAYQKNLISKEVHDSIIAESQNRFTFLGKGVNTIKFYDNMQSYDLLLSSGVCNTLVGLGAGAAGSAVGYIVSLIPPVGVLGGAVIGVGVGAIVATLITENYDFSHGIVAYFKYGRFQYIYSQ